MRILILGLAIIALTSCTTTQETKVLHACPFEATTTTPIEPKAPDGALLNDEASIWLGTELLPWARDMKSRLDTIKKDCL